MKTLIKQIRDSGFTAESIDHPPLDGVFDEILALGPVALVFPIGLPGAGKTKLTLNLKQQGFAVTGMSDAYIEPSVVWWNSLSPDDRRIMAREYLPEGHWRGVFNRNNVKASELVPTGNVSDEDRDEAAERKNAFRDVITKIMREARQIECGGHAHAPAIAALLHVLEGRRTGIVDGFRTLADFEALALAPGSKVLFIHIDASQRKPLEKMRIAETERDFLQIVLPLEKYAKESAHLEWLTVDNNGDLEAFQAQFPGIKARIDDLFLPFA